MNEEGGQGVAAAIVAEVPQALEVPPHRNHNHEAVVTSADESSSSDEEETGDSEDDEPLNSHPDELFDDQADQDDEVYVYKHLRCGIEETVTVKGQREIHHEEEAKIQEQGSVPIQQPGKKSATVKILKPRHSDAILSCPCCFNIVCMDCQRHERFENQFRAMFVVGIAVRWDLRLIYDESEKRLVPAPTPAQSFTASTSDTSHSNRQGRAAIVPIPFDIGEDEDAAADAKLASEEKESPKQIYYYTVCCAKCQTTVAALDMTDEVYYFHGCLASS